MMKPPTGLFQQFADAVRPEIEGRLESYAEFGPGCPARLQAAIHHSLLAPGKRLRPLLVLSAAETCGSTREAAMPAACAVELVHTYSLIHDDLPAMDDDDLRRGRPSCHAAFDEATAILAGDALLTRAFEILATDLPADVAAPCCAELAHAAGAEQMVGGQADDLAAEHTGGDLRQLEEIHRRKTGALLTVSLRLGGLTAHASREQLDRLTAYGRHLGLAFQIIDDLLDLTGNVDQIGKKTGQDSHRGKLTFPALLGVEASRQRAIALIDEAIAQLEPFAARAGHLEALARYVLERNR
jgi:geranylgeranyl diphosphate synthase, type II